MALHNQLLLNGHITNPMMDENKVIDWMKNLVEEIDMKIIQGPYASYVEKEGNRGITCTVMIETSHIAVHVWDEEEPSLIQFDLYTCSHLPEEKVIKNLKDNFGLIDYQYMILERSSGFNVKESRLSAY